MEDLTFFRTRISIGILLMYENRLSCKLSLYRYFYILSVTLLSSRGKTQKKQAFQVFSCKV